MAQVIKGARVWTKGERKTNKVEGLLLVNDRLGGFEGWSQDDTQGVKHGQKSIVVTCSIVEERKIEGKEIE